MNDRIGNTDLSKEKDEFDNEEERRKAYEKAVEKLKEQIN